MVGRPAAAHRALQEQRQLLADPGLADQLVQPPGPQRALDHPVVGVGHGRDHAVGGVLPHGGLGVPAGHVRPSTRSAARRATDTSTA